jgi:hypothetical protein
MMAALEKMESQAQVITAVPVVQVPELVCLAQPQPVQLVFMPLLPLALVRAVMVDKTAPPQAVMPRILVAEVVAQTWQLQPETADPAARVKCQLRQMSVLLLRATSLWIKSVMDQQA